MLISVAYTVLYACYKCVTRVICHYKCFMSVLHVIINVLCNRFISVLYVYYTLCYKCFISVLIRYNTLVLQVFYNCGHKYFISVL